MPTTPAQSVDNCSLAISHSIRQTYVNGNTEAHVVDITVSNVGSRYATYAGIVLLYDFHES